MPHRDSSSSDGIEIELIRSLYDAFVPSVIMSAGFIVCGALIVWSTGDTLLLVPLIGGALASAARLIEAWRGSKRVARTDLTIEQARRLEQRFAIAYCAFALMLGMFGARVFQLPSPQAQMLTICLVVGYAAGVAAGIGLRPRIAIPSMLMAIVPAIVTALFWGDVLYWATAAMTAALLAGGIRSLRGRHDRAVRDIDRRILFATLARQDVLTALPNRLALREWFDEHSSPAATRNLVAVHCLDLNGFKPINDGYGHPVGDALLAAVAKRLARTIRETDMAARLGGDEFAVVQCGIGHADEAALLAQRLQAAIGRSFQLDEHIVSISTCVGYVVSDDPTDNLEHLISLADEALYAGKRAGRGVTRYEPAPLGERAAA